MADKYYVLVAGNGDTSRANIEALMDDHYYAKGENGVLVLAYEKTPTRPQMFAAQFAKEKEKEIIFYGYEDAQPIGIHGAKFMPTGFPIRDAVKSLEGLDGVIFSIHQEGDIDSNLLVKHSIEYSVPIFNLKDGLMPLSDVAEEPIPAAEPSPVKVTEPKAEIETETETPVTEKLPKAKLQPLNDIALEEAIKHGIKEAIRFLKANDFIA